ncbi:hypothetical protein [Actinomyces ruminis]|uniref:Homeodomain-like domain-containing protein n=1 Tax=Actinomyces ruminis TaxID=1937003 RepID=A0ABX4MAT2_9ACTO|nr:hypothetical protein [Actinomyces ruminis]PHP52585.1 hypothetical protein BW737_008865 [Actinomyces ruminis]
MYDRAAIRALAAQGKTAGEIAASLGATITTVRRALDLSQPTAYQRDALADGPVGDQIRAVLAQYPQMKATGIAYRISWTGSMRTLRHVVAQIRAEHEEARPDG